MCANLGSGPSPCGLIGFESRCPYPPLRCDASKTVTRRVATLGDCNNTGSRKCEPDFTWSFPWRLALVWIATSGIRLCPRRRKCKSFVPTPSVGTQDDGNGTATGGNRSLHPDRPSSCHPEPGFSGRRTLFIVRRNAGAQRLETAAASRAAWVRRNTGVLRPELRRSG